MSRDIFIVRHGSRIDFEDKSWAKRAPRPFDPPLSTLGQRQARETGAYLANGNHKDIVALYASPFLRTVQTATAIADALDLPIRVEPGIAEWLNPQWFAFDGWYSEPSKLRERFPRVDATYEPLVLPRYPETTLNTCHARCAYVVRHLAAEINGNIALVGHGVTVQGMMMGLAGSAEGMNSHLCAVNVVRQDSSGWTLREATTGHLSSSESRVQFN